MHLCAACGRTTDHSLRFRIKGYDILQCRNCGLGRADACEFDSAGSYTEDYFSGRRPDGYSDYCGAEPVLRREFARSINFIRRYRSSGRLLVIGCAYGFFLREAVRYFDVVGIELAEKAADYGRRAGLNVLQGTADEPTLRQAGRVDIIVLFDVIEHLPEPRQTLALCHECLNPDGIIVITTGDFGSAFAKLAGAKWRLMTPPQHLWFFTQESMRRLSAGLGLVIQGVDYPSKILPASFIIFQLQRMLGFPAARLPAASPIGVPVN